MPIQRDMQEKLKGHEARMRGVKDKLRSLQVPVFKPPLAVRAGRGLKLRWAAAAWGACHGRLLRGRRRVRGQDPRPAPCRLLQHRTPHSVISSSLFQTLYCLLSFVTLFFFRVLVRAWFSFSLPRVLALLRSRSAAMPRRFESLQVISTAVSHARLCARACG